MKRKLTAVLLTVVLTAGSIYPGFAQEVADPAMIADDLARADEEDLLQEDTDDLTQENVSTTQGDISTGELFEGLQDEDSLIQEEPGAANGAAQTDVADGMEPSDLVLTNDRTGEDTAEGTPAEEIAGDAAEDTSVEETAEGALSKEITGDAAEGTPAEEMAEVGQINGIAEGTPAGEIAGDASEDSTEEVPDEDTSEAEETIIEDVSEAGENVFATATELTFRSGYAQGTAKISEAYQEAYFKLVPDETAIYEFLTNADENDDTDLTLYSSSGARLSYDDDDGSEYYASRIVYKMFSGETYYLRVRFYEGETGDIPFTVSEIASENVNLSEVLTVMAGGSDEEAGQYYQVKPGQEVTLSLVSRFKNDTEDYLSPYYTYTWYCADTEVGSGASSINVVPAQSGRYWCRIGTSWTNYDINSAYIEIDNQLQVYTDSRKADSYVSRKVAYGSTEIFEPAVDVSDGAVTFEWKSDADNYAQVLSRESRYQIDPVTRNVSYRCYVIDKYGNRACVTYRLEVENHLSVYADEQGDDDSAEVLVRPGESAVLTPYVVADDPAVTYQWTLYGTGGDAVVSTGSSYTTGPVTQPASYSCRVTDAYGNNAYVYYTVSADNHLKVTVEAGSDDTDKTIDLSPQDPSVTMIPYISADDMSGMTYEWTYREDDYKDVTVSTGADYTINPVTRPASYYFKATDQYGNTASVTYNVKVENHLEVYASAGAEEGDLEYEQVLSINPGESVTMTPYVIANDTHGMVYTWYQAGRDEIYDVDPLPVTQASYTIVSPVTTTYTCIVADAYGNEGFAEYRIHVENGLEVYVKEGTASDRETLEEPLNSTITLTPYVHALNMENVTYSWWSSSGLAQGSDPSYTLQVTGSATYSCTVTDQYKNRKTVHYDVRVDNHFTVSADQSQVVDYAVIPAAAGTSVTLQVYVSGDDLSQAAYRWRRLINSDDTEPAGNTDSLQVTAGAADVYYCRVDDGYGNTQYVFYYVGTVVEGANKSDAAVAKDGILNLPCEVPAYIRFTPEVSGTYKMYSVTMNTDTYADLYTADGTKVSSGENLSDDGNFTIEADLTAGTTYFLEITGYEWDGNRLAYHIELENHDHRWDEGVITTAATCGQAGVKTYTCTVCGATKTEAIPATGEHSWDAGVITTAATCGQAGVKTYTCTVCGATKTEAIPATGEHTPVTDPAVPATTTTAGKTQGGHCEVCGTVLVAQETIPVLSVDGDADDPTSVAGNAAVLHSLGRLKEADGAAFSQFKLQISGITSKAITIKWSKQKGASGYIVYGSRYGGKLRQLKEVGSATRKYTHRGLKKATSYKYIVVAYKTNADGTRTVLATSTSVYGTTSGGSKTSVKSVKAAKKSITVKKGKKAAIKLTLTGFSSGKSLRQQRGIRYVTSNNNVTVSKKGVITGRKKGKCTIYAYTASGNYVKIRVTVK